MPDLSDFVRRSVEGAAATYEPSPGLSQRIARRTLQLQRRRRARIVGGAAMLATAVLAVPLVLPSRRGPNSVGVSYEPVNITAQKARVTTTTTTAPSGVLDLQGFIDNGLRERDQALARLATGLRRRDRDEAAKRRTSAEVLGARGRRDAARPTSAPPAVSPGTIAAPSSTTKKPSTATTGPTTTTSPPPTTQPTAPVVPLSIIAPSYVCEGVPATFTAVGTGADLVVWSNKQVGSTATFTFTASTSISARLDLAGAVSHQSIGVSVTPNGTPPC